MPDKLVRYIILIHLIVFSHWVKAQKKWVGNNAGGWENSLNWQPLGIPSVSDDVILDNTFQGNSYIIALPDIAVSIRSLTIAPMAGKFIELLLPSSNKNSPALIVTGSGDAIVVRKGGIFRNSSGLTSGQSTQVSGSIFISDDGSYIHNSRSAHANDIVANLSTATGTERGIFEFDVPGGSYPISLSNRTFGTLILSSAASGGTQTYNATGASPVTINGDFQINTGVQFNADLTKDMIVNGDYNQQGGVFNLASQANNNTIKINGNIKQAPLSVITETSGGIPVIELSGSLYQSLSFAGNITNSVVLRINNSNGVSLTYPLILPFRLEMVKGVMKTSATNIITLLDSCLVIGGSYNSYIEGPVKKTGSADFEFPIGKQGDYAPLKIIHTTSGAVDEFTAEYFLANPQTIYGSQFENPPILRVSALEYWSLKRSAGSASCKVSLSVRTYSHATALDKLVVARWDAANLIWKNEGNSAYSGIATGTITSNVVGGFNAFTLATTVANQNPLPVTNFEFNGIRNSDELALSWEIEEDMPGDYFVVEQSFDRKKYAMVVKADRKAGVSKYHFIIQYNEERTSYFRLKFLEANGNFRYSDVVAIPATGPGFKIIKFWPSPVINNAVLTVIANQGGMIVLVISDMRGRVITIIKQLVRNGKNEIYLPLADVLPGVYVIRINNAKLKFNGIRFVKL